MVCVVAIQACGNSSGSEKSAQSTPASVAGIPLPQTMNAQRLQKLIDLNQTQGFDQKVDPDIAGLLGLDAVNGSVMVRQLSVKKSKVDVVSFSQFKAGTAGYIFAGQNSTGTYIFRVDENLNFLKAVKRVAGNVPPTPIADADAQNDFHAVMSIWARLADAPPTATELIPEPSPDSLDSLDLGKGLRNGGQ
jgi:hypothetical protein